jgi:hypothetical protein
MVKKDGGWGKSLAIKNGEGGTQDCGYNKK